MIETHEWVDKLGETNQVTFDKGSGAAWRRRGTAIHTHGSTVMGLEILRLASLLEDKETEIKRLKRALQGTNAKERVRP